MGRWRRRGTPGRCSAGSRRSPRPLRRRPRRRRRGGSSGRREVRDRRRAAPPPRARHRPSTGGRRGSRSASTSSTWSRIGSTSTSGVPGSRSSGRTMIPAWSSPRPTSSSARIIPRDAWPRSSTLVERPSEIGRRAPGSATATVAPASKFQAPQTICRASPSPTSTWHTRSRSAFGMRRDVETRDRPGSGRGCRPSSGTPTLDHLVDLQRPK